ncbi:DNA-binding transcriptional regulator, XRE family [Lachnospiraceae bacterium]|nr:DNA-binding transcriptional regulator, XRE family [Lachnospiraceae bacterium]
MGDGKNLKEILDSKNMSVRELSRRTGISRTTIYSIIQKDTNIRFDFALRIANELDIETSDICSNTPFSGDIAANEVFPALPEGLNSVLDSGRIKMYLKNSLYPLMNLFGKKSMPDVDNLLTSFYKLDDEARQEIIEMIKIKLKTHTDKEREKEIKQIKGW